MEYKLDIIVPTHNHLGLTIACIEALYANTASPFHLIVIDDSIDLTPQYFATLAAENITFIHSDEPYHSGNQIFNIGFEKCLTPYVATVMNSVRVEPDWDIPGLALLDAKPDFGIVGFKCLFDDGTGRIESAGLAMFDSKLVAGGQYADVSTHMCVDISRDWPGHRATNMYEPDAVQWAFALHRLEAVKGNIEDIFHGFVGSDDLDNCFAVKAKGWKIAYCGASAGYHSARATRDDDSKDAARKNEENLHMFFKRHGFRDARGGPRLFRLHAH